MPRTLRIVLASVGGLALLAVLAVVVTLYLLLQPERFTALLQSQASAIGLELNLASPASPTLLPRPALELRGITLSASGANTPILLAARGRLGLPWRTLFGGPVAISQLQIDAPRVDLGALQAWMHGLPSQPAGAPSYIPHINTGIRIRQGSLVRGDQLLLGNLELETGSLIPDTATSARMSATTARGTVVQMQVTATPRLQSGALQLDAISLHLSQGAATMLDLHGDARWRGAADATVTLAGTLDHADSGHYTVTLSLTPADQSKPLLLALKLDGPGNHADLQLPPLALVQWWNQLGDPTPHLSVPPGTGQLEISRLDVGSISMEGVTVQAGDNGPAAAGTTATTKAARQP